MPRIVAILYTVVLVACGGDNPPSNNDASNPIDASSDARGDATVSTLCGVSPGAAWSRCSVNPLVEGTRPAVEAGRTEWTQADPTVLFDPSDQLWKAWWSTVTYTDCSQVLSEREIHIKYADSTDGLSWRIQAEPVLRSHRTATDWDFSTVETPAVIRLPDAPPERRFAMIYAGGNDATLRVLGQTGWQLGVAFSSDGKHFTRISAAESPYAGRTTPFANIEGLALLASDAFPDVAGVDRGIVADPEVVAYGGAYHVYFSSVAVDAGGAYVPDTYGISHATSTDLIHWTAAPNNPISSLYGGGQPAILVEGSQLTMYFGQDSDADRATIPSAVFSTLGFWRATSSDGTTWTRANPAARDFTWRSTDPAESLGLLNGAAIARGPDDFVRLYYAAWGTQRLPPDSCVFVYDRSTGSPVLTSVAGTNNLMLAVRR